jgi:uncharacterized protein with GYD domain
MLSVCVLIRTLHGKDANVVKSLSQLDGIKRIFPVLGRFDVVVDLEVSDFKELGNIVMRMGNFYGVVFTETLIEPTKSNSVLDKLLKMDFVRKAFDTYGRFDITVFVEVKDYQMMVEVTNEINGLEGVRSTETLLEA